MKDNRPFLSIIVPTYNASPELTRLLRSIEASPFPDREILVVDDGSTDGTLSMLERAPVRLLRTPRNRGPAFARNQGALAARGEVLLFLDSDVEIEPAALPETARFFRENPDRSVMIGVYSAAPANEGAWPLYKALQCYSYYSSFPDVKEVTLLWAAIAAFRRDVFLRSGGFDTRFSRPSMEDLELGRRIAPATPIYLNRRVVARHNFPSTFAKNVADHFDRGRLWVRIYFRHHRFDNYLSTPRRALGRVAASATLPLLALSGALPVAGAAAAASFGLYAACNHDLWRSVARRRPWFLPTALAFDFLLGLVLGAAALVACGDELVALVQPARRKEAEGAAVLAPDPAAEAVPVPTAETGRADEPEEAAALPGR